MLFWHTMKKLYEIFSVVLVKWIKKSFAKNWEQKESIAKISTNVDSQAEWRLKEQNMVIFDLAAPTVSMCTFTLVQSAQCIHYILFSYLQKIIAQRKASVHFIFPPDSEAVECRRMFVYTFVFTPKEQKTSRNELNYHHEYMKL